MTDHSNDLSGIKGHKSSAGVEYNLHNCIDFRVKRSELTSNGRNPVNPFGRIQFEFETYMPRVDRVYLTADGTIEVEQGIPSAQNSPTAPKERENSMTLGTLSLPAYTNIAQSVKVRNKDNKRYTMRDIGKLEDRIEDLEVYTA